MKLFTSVTRMPLFSKTSLETVGFSVKRRRKPFLVKNSLTYTSEASELLFKKTVTNFHGTAFNPWRERREEGGGPQGGRCAALRAGAGVGPGRPSSCGTNRPPEPRSCVTVPGNRQYARGAARWAAPTAASTRTRQANTRWTRISGLRAPCADDSRVASRRPCVYLLGRPRSGCGRAGFAGLAGI